MGRLLASRRVPALDLDISFDYWSKLRKVGKSVYYWGKILKGSSPRHHPRAASQEIVRHRKYLFVEDLP
jgi:hypothetical protein